MRRTRIFVAVAAAFVAGCGLLIGLEDRELPTVPAEASPTTDAPIGMPDAPGTDAPVDAPIPPVDGGDGGTDANTCTCADGCTDAGVCLSEIVALGVGRNHNCVVRADGKLFCIGRNDLAQLATTVGAQKDTYVPITALDGAGAAIKWRDVSAAGASTCGLSTNGDLYCWGVNSRMQLAQDTAGAPQPTPKKVDLGAAKVTRFSVGAYHACAIIDVANGPNVRCWGNGTNGELGTDTDAGASADQTATPQTVVGLRAKTIHANDTDSAPEGGRTCAVSEANIPFCWGLNAGHEITADAVPSTCTDPCTLAPLRFDPVATNALFVGSAIRFGCELLSGAPNTIRCRGDLGDLVADPVACTGSSQIFDFATPTLDPKTLAISSTHACFIDAKSDVYCFGDNEFLETGLPGSDKCGAHALGFARRGAVASGVPAPGGGIVKAKLLAVGRGNGLVYTTTRTLVGWGWGSYGELGLPLPDAGPVDGGDDVDAGVTCTGNNRCTVARPLTLPAFP